MNKVIEFGASFNPPGNHHIIIAKKLTEIFEKVIIVPCGIRSDKPSTAAAPPTHRKEMVKLAFSDIPNLEIDFYDFDNNVFTPTWMLDQRYKQKFPGSEIWHMVGGDLIFGGRNSKSEIQQIWNKGPEIWNKLNWAVIDHHDYPIDERDLPPHNMIVKMEAFRGRSTLVRRRRIFGQDIDDLVSSKVAEYIYKHRLYLPDSKI